jgi:D-beta-D-heptose 7-phosphate kinase/D-beta-D-heptose 1-phosphate adenosyltransferase
MTIIIRDLKKYKSYINKIKKKITLTSGCFDLFHYGHAKFLNEASKLSNFFIVALNSDISIKKIKGKKRPILSLKNRLGLLSSLNFIDIIIIFDEETPFEIIKITKPYYFVKGGDYKKLDNNLKNFSLYCKKIKLLNFVKGLSTSNIINSIKKI